MPISKETPMKKDVQKSITEALQKVNAGGKIEEAVSEILSDAGIKPGATVAILHDPINGMEGIRGKIKSLSEDGGYADVDLGNGTIVKVMTNLLAVVA
jgi:hypothetical protein